MNGMTQKIIDRITDGSTQSWAEVYRMFSAAPQTVQDDVVSKITHEQELELRVGSPSFCHTADTRLEEMPIPERDDLIGGKTMHEKNVVRTMNTYRALIDNGEGGETTITAASMDDAWSQATEWAMSGDWDVHDNDADIPTLRVYCGDGDERIESFRP